MTAPSCPVEGCPRTRSSGHAMCRPCWRRVTKPTQDKVYSTWRRINGPRGFASLDDMSRAWAAYREAREQAIREAEA